MKKTIITVILLIALFDTFFCFASCNKKDEVQTGEAIINVSETWEKAEDGSYKLSSSYGRHDTNIRNYVDVTVNEETTWKLSKNEDGTESYETFMIALNYGRNIVYISCYDRIGFTKSYRLILDVEKDVKNFFYTDFNHSQFENYHKRELNKIDSWSEDVSYMKFFENYVNYYGWKEIYHHSEKYGKFYCETTNGSFDTETTLPNENPTKSGYTFDGWKEIDITSPRALSDSFYGGKGSVYKLYVAKWKLVQ